MEPKKEIMNQLNYVRKWKTKFITAIPKLNLQMKVLLTGHSGFIGQSILKLLLKKIKLFVTKYNKLLIPEKNISYRFKKNIQLTSFDLVIHAAWDKLEDYNSQIM